MDIKNKGAKERPTDKNDTSTTSTVIHNIANGAYEQEETKEAHVRIETPTGRTRKHELNNTVLGKRYNSKCKV